MSKPRERSSSTSSTRGKRNGKVAASSTVLPQTPEPLPAANDRDAWHAYWTEQGQPWRTEPEINAERQKELNQHRAIVPDIEKGIYPFKGMKLSRADVEWLLATHANGRGPVDWSDKQQRIRTGLDVRGMDLRNVDLSYLPLACLLGSEYPKGQWLPVTTHALNDIAGVHLEGANLFEAHLEGANLINAHLEQASLNRANLEEADLRLAHLEEAQLRGAHLEGANLYRAHLEAAGLGSCYLSVSTKLREINLGNEQLGFAFLGNVHWDNADLSGVEWSQMRAVGQESKARQAREKNGERKNTTIRYYEYRFAVRSYRQLAVALQAQGLNEDAAHFAYRAQLLQRRVWWFQMFRQESNPKQVFQALSAWLFSWFLLLLAGYGYKPSRSFLAYFLVIFSFATAYYFLSHAVGPVLSPLGAFVFSMTSFHGRGFFPGNNISLDNPLTVLAALEALVGLIIEVTFIATLTQRFFNR